MNEGGDAHRSMFWSDVRANVMHVTRNGLPFFGVGGGGEQPPAPAPPTLSPGRAIGGLRNAAGGAPNGLD